MVVAYVVVFVCSSSFRMGCSAVALRICCVLFTSSYLGWMEDTSLIDAGPPGRADGFQFVIDVKRPLREDAHHPRPIFLTGRELDSAIGDLNFEHHHGGFFLLGPEMFWCMFV